MKTYKPHYQFLKAAMQAVVLVLFFSCDPDEPELSSEKTITEFSFRAVNNPGLSADVNGSVVGESILITLPTGSVVTALKPTIVHTGNTISPAVGTAVDFTSPVDYTVTAIDESTKMYEVTVTVTPPVLSSEKTLTSFSFLKADNPALSADVLGTINGLNIACTLPSGVSVTALKPTIVHTGSSINPASGAANNFTAPATYTVKAEDGSTENYTITVTVAASGPVVYVVGGQTFNGTQRVRVWKDGVGTSLTNGTYYSGGSSVFVKGNTLHVAGSQTIGNIRASSWKIENGIELPTPGLNETNNDAYANSIFVSDNNDIYIAGQENHGASVGTIAKIWKNGVATHLSTVNGAAFSVFVSGSDVYAAGYESTSEGWVAKSWKNGTAQTLSQTDGKAYGKAVFVKDGIAYVAGHTWNKAASKWVIGVWRDNVPGGINGGGIGSIPNDDNAEVEGMFIYGLDIYLVGFERRGTQNNAKIWKNGVGTFLSDKPGSNAKSVYVHNGDVYVAGYETNSEGKRVAMLWKNGVGTALATDAYAYGVMVK